MPIERKLAAIMFTDIAGYTESMSKSESKSLDTLEKKRSILKPLLKEYKGTFVKEIGDGTLSYFESAVNAATCAVKLQETTYDDKEMNIRVGIHIGDIVFKDGDVFGGGVNVASRLESIAPAGGVCVSKSVYDELSNQDDFDGIELGLQSLKGVGRLIEVFGLKGEKLNEPKPSEYQDNKVAVHSDDEVPSIAIIPFRNKGKEEDAFYAYGICADLISDCSSAGLIRVESLDRIEKIENYDKFDITELATKLLVRYVTTGTLWKMDDYFQLSVELYDTKESKIVWSDRWQEKWENLPTIKGSLSDGLLKALDTKPKIEKKVEMTNAEAYEFYLRGKHIWKNRKEKGDLNIARNLFKKAIELDNNLIGAKTSLAFTYFFEGDSNQALDLYKLAYDCAKIIDNKKEMAASILGIGMINSYLDNHEEHFKCLIEAKIIYEKLGDKSGNAGVLLGLSSYYSHKCNYDESIKYLKKLYELNKQLGEQDGHTLYVFAAKYLFMGKLNQAHKYLNRTIKYYKSVENNPVRLAYAYGLLGEYYLEKSNYSTAINYFEKELKYWKDVSEGYDSAEFRLLTFIYWAKKKMNLHYDKKKIYKLIQQDNLDKKEKGHPQRENYYWSLKLYELLEDSSFLKTVYNQIQKKADNLEPNVAAKFLSYPIPKAIVEEWEKVK